MHFMKTSKQILLSTQRKKTLRKPSKEMEKFHSIELVTSPARPNCVKGADDDHT